MNANNQRSQSVGILLPTYNEAENIRPLLQQIRLTLPEAWILVVDDDSPDGTWRIVSELAETDPRLELLRRQELRGRGSAGIDGFRHLLERPELDAMVELDADFSHHPAHLPALLAALNEADVVLGSRYVSGGADGERGTARRLLSLAANSWVRFVLGIPVLDCTSGFRAFRRQALLDLGIDQLVSRGPSIVTEMLYRARQAGLRIREIPIRFRERKAGVSQLSIRVLVHSFIYVIRLRCGGR